MQTDADRCRRMQADAQAELDEAKGTERPYSLKKADLAELTELSDAKLSKPSNSAPKQPRKNK